MVAKNILSNSVISMLSSFQYYCMYCVYVYSPGDQLGANRQSYVHAKSSSQNSAPKRKTTLNKTTTCIEPTHAFATDLATSLSLEKLLKETCMTSSIGAIHRGNTTKQTEDGARP